MEARYERNEWEMRITDVTEKGLNSECIKSLHTLSRDETTWSIEPEVGECK